MLLTPLKKSLVVILLCFLSFHAFTQNNSSLDWAKKTGARKQPSSKQTFLVNDFGATNKGESLATTAIQKAIDACAIKGGGIVSFKPGTYLTGSIFLKSNVHLKIDKEVIIIGSQDFADYPEIDTRIAGIEMKWPAALINILDQKNVKISGDGKINARGKFCWDKYWALRREYEPKGLRWASDYDAKRVRSFLVQSSSDVTLEGLTFANSGFWTVQLLYSDHVTVNKVTIRNNEDGHGPSTDGIDIDSSTWILVENCDIDCNDDNFCLKAGRDWDGQRVNRPTEYVVIRNSIARRGAGVITVGSETAGSIRHVLATGMRGIGTSNGFLIKSATTRGGTVEDIHFTDNIMDSVRTAFSYTMNWNPAYSYSKLPPGYNYDSIPAHWKILLHQVEPAEKGIPHFKNIYVSGITVKQSGKAITAVGLDKSYLENFYFSNVKVKAGTAGEISFAKDWKWTNVTITSDKGDKVAITNSTGLSL
ncbi:MAG: glycosyl hydrolase family 28 protein [Chitinophagaceae bacterium]